jgi:Zn-dependent protease
VSTLGILVSDLRRSRTGYLAVSLLARTVWRGHVYARHDGPVSMRAAYTMAEARELAARAGLTGARVEAVPGFRWTMRWRRPA